MTEYIVQTTSGRVRGQERDGLVEYLGIPYAEPPVGPLRFKRAVPVKPWLDVYEAKEYGPVPVQKDKGTDMGEEDCLTVNVKRPAKGGEFTGFCVYLWRRLSHRQYQRRDVYRRGICQRRTCLCFVPVQAERSGIL